MEVQKIYFDMDSVLADFVRGVREICGMEAGTHDAKDDDMWALIKAADHFYYRLEPVEGAKAMFDSIYGRFGDRVEILTAVPKKKRGILTAGDDKTRWIREMFSGDVKVNIVVREEKMQFCKGKGCILIDDLEKNLEEWNAAGGTGILFRNAEQALKEFEEIIA